MLVKSEHFVRLVSAYEMFFYSYAEWLHAVTNGTESLYTVPKEFLTNEIRLAGVFRDGFSLETIPVKLRTVELCTVAVNNFGRALDSVPDNLKSPELCLTAVKNNAYSLHFVPDDIKTYEMCLIALNSSGVFDAVPTRFYTPILLANAVKSFLPVNKVPIEYQTEEFWLELYSSGTVDMSQIPEEHCDYIATNSILTKACRTP